MDFADSAATGATVPATGCLSKLAVHAEAVLASGGVEDVHQLRVNAARLRVWLRLGGVKALDDDLSWLRDQAAEVRDLDVQIEASPPKGVQRTLVRKRRAALENLRASLKDERFAALSNALTLLPAPPLARAEKALRKLAARASKLGGHGVWRHGASDGASRKEALQALHRLRRHVRRVRYAVQWLQRDASELIAFQEALGEVCNHVMTIDKQSSAKGAAAYHQRLRREVTDAQRAAVESWKKVKTALEELSHEPVHHSPRNGGTPVRHADRRGASAH